MTFFIRESIGLTKSSSYSLSYERQPCTRLTAFLIQRMTRLRKLIATLLKLITEETMRILGLPQALFYTRANAGRLLDVCWIV